MSLNIKLIKDLTKKFSLIFLFLLLITPFFPNIIEYDPPPVIIECSPYFINTYHFNILIKKSYESWFKEEYIYWVGRAIDILQNEIHQFGKKYGFKYLEEITFSKYIEGKNYTSNYFIEINFIEENSQWGGSMHL